MQAPAGGNALKRKLACFAATLLAGCVSHVYQPGLPDNPLRQLQLGQTYGDMIKVMGEPDHSRSEDRRGTEATLLMIPVWNFVELAGDFNPSAVQIYTYDRWGKVTVDDHNRIIRIEALGG